MRNPARTSSWSSTSTIRMLMRHRPCCRWWRRRHQRQQGRCRMSIRIVLVDDQELVRAGFRMVLDAQPDMEVVGEAGDGLAATQLLRTTPADVGVMDDRMPRLDGIEATRQICQAGDRPRVLRLTTFD